MVEGKSNDRHGEKQFSKADKNRASGQPDNRGASDPKTKSISEKERQKLGSVSTDW